MTRDRLRVLAATILAFTLVVTAAGVPAKTTAPRKWAKTFCTTFSAWQEELDDLQDDFAQTMATATAGADAAAVVRAAEELLESAADATDDVKRTLARAGVPDVKNGARISATIVKAFGRAADDFEEIALEVAALDPADPASLAAAGERIDTMGMEAGDRIGDALERAADLDSRNQLGQAITAVRACDALA